MAAKYLFLAVSVVCFSLPIHISCSTGNDVTDPCDVGDHIVLDSTNRIHTIHENNGLCDDNLTEGWYKLEVSGRPVEIPSLCLQNNVCGTQLPMRMDLAGGGMPADNETVNAFVCTSYEVLGKWDCCVLRQPIKIKNCGAFYVYRLKPTDRCPVAYCAQEVGTNPSANLTRKRGDVINNGRSTTLESNTFHNTRTTPESNTVENTRTTTESNTVENTGSHLTTNVHIYNTTSDIIGPSSESSTTVSNMTGSVTMMSEEVTTLSTDDNTSVSENISNNVVSTTNTDQTVITESPISNVSSRLTTSADDSSVANTTVIDNTTAVGNIITTDSSREDSASNSQTTTSGQSMAPDVTITVDPSSNLPCINWIQTPCADGNTTCYREPTTNMSYIVCADGSGCGQTCDSSPDCVDESDELQPLCPGRAICSESQQLCSDQIHCFQRCDGVATCDSPTAGEDEVGCHSTTKASIIPNTYSSMTTLTTNNTQGFEEETSNITSRTLTQSTPNLTQTIVNVNDSTDDVAATSDSSTLTTTLSLSTSTSSDLIDETSVTTGSESETLHQNSTSGLTSLSELPENETLTIPVGPTTSFMDSTTSNDPSISDTSTNQELTESVSVTTTPTPSLQDQTSVTEQSALRNAATESATLHQTESSSQVVVTSQHSNIDPVTTEIKYNSSESSSTSTDPVTGPTLTAIYQTISTQSSEEMTRHTSHSVTTTDDSNTILSTDDSPSDSTTDQEPVHQSSTGVRDSTTTSTNGDIGGASFTPVRSDRGHTSAGYQNRTSISDRMDSSTAASTFPESTSLSAKHSSVTGPDSTSTGDNNTDHTIHVEGENTGLYYENFGLFVFLIVAGVVIAGVCIFGIAGYTYQRRLRTWNPTMAYQDAYGDFEKRPLPFGREKLGVESPIPDFDILRDEKKYEETSLSQASTVALGPTNGKSGPIDDSYGEDPREQMTNGKTNDDSCQQNVEASKTHSNDSYLAYENADGVVSVDEIDISPPRTLFPWIENAADTKL